MMNKLPELTEEERAVLDGCNMYKILGPWEHRYEIAMESAIKWYHSHREQQAKIKRLEAEVKLLQKETEVPKIATFEVRYKCDNGKTEHIRFFESLHFAQEYMDWLENQGIEFLSLQFYLLIESRVFLIK